MLDSAAQVTLISQAIYSQLAVKPQEGEEVWLRGASEARFRGTLVPCFKFRLGTRFYTLDIIVAGISDKFILGNDFLSEFDCIIDFRRYSHYRPGDCRG